MAEDIKRVARKLLRYLQELVTISQSPNKHGDISQIWSRTFTRPASRLSMDFTDSAAGSEIAKLYSTLDEVVKTMLRPSSYSEDGDEQEEDHDAREIRGRAAGLRPAGLAPVEDASDESDEDNDDEMEELIEGSAGEEPMTLLDGDNDEEAVEGSVQDDGSRDGERDQRNHSPLFVPQDETFSGHRAADDDSPTSDSEVRSFLISQRHLDNVQHRAGQSHSVDTGSQLPTPTTSRSASPDTTSKSPDSFLRSARSKKRQRETIEPPSEKRARHHPPSTASAPRKSGKQKPLKETLPTLLFSPPDAPAFNERDEAVLELADSALLIEEQVALLASGQCVPLTEIQWNEFGSIVDRVAAFVEDQGAFLLQPDLEVPKVDLSNAQCVLDFEVIKKTTFEFGEVAGLGNISEEDSWSWITLDRSRETVKTYSCCFASDHTDEQDLPISFDDFEDPTSSKLTAYARVISGDRYESLMKNFKLDEHLRDLRGNELPVSTDISLEGVNEPCMYLGEKGSPLSVRLVGQNLWFVSYLYSGTRDWIVIPPSNKERMDELLGNILQTQYGAEPLCEQFGSHLNACITQDTLRKWNIEFHVMTQRAGQFVLIGPHTYHMGVNSTQIIAAAINYARAWDNSDYALCNSDCVKFQDNESAPVLNISAHIDSVWKINSMESVAQKDFAKAREQIADTIYESKTQKKIGGKRAADIVKLILHLGSENVVNAILQALEANKLTTRVFSSCSDSDIAVSSYRALLLADGLTNLGEIAGRVAILTLHRIVTEAMAKKRTARVHRAGISKPEPKKADIIRDVAMSIAKQLDRTELEKVAPVVDDADEWIHRVATQIDKRIHQNWRTAEMCLHTFQGLGIEALILMPTSSMCATVNIPRSHEILNRAMDVKLFVQYFGSLRPQFAKLVGSAQMTQLNELLWRQGILPKTEGGSILV